MLTGLTHTRAARNLLRGFGIPVVETWETGDEPVDMAVGYSNREAAHAMTAELIRSGYRRIAFVNGPAENNERARHRAEGYLAAMREAGLAAPPIHVVHDEAAIRPETGAKAIRDPRATARRSTRCSLPATSSPSARSSPAASSASPCPTRWASPASTTSRSAGW